MSGTKSLVAAILAVAGSALIAQALAEAPAPLARPGAPDATSSPAPPAAFPRPAPGTPTPAISRNAADASPVPAAQPAETMTRPPKIEEARDPLPSLELPPDNLLNTWSDIQTRIAVKKLQLEEKKVDEALRELEEGRSRSGDGRPAAMPAPGRPAVQPSAPTVPADIPPAVVRRIGGVDGKLSARLALPDGAVVTVRVGSRLPNGYRVTAISTDGVRLSDDTRTVDLTFGDDVVIPKQSAPVTASNIPPSPAPAAPRR